MPEATGITSCDNVSCEVNLLDYFLYSTISMREEKTIGFYFANILDIQIHTFIYLSTYQYRTDKQQQRAFRAMTEANHVPWGAARVDLPEAAIPWLERIVFLRTCP